MNLYKVLLRSSTECVVFRYYAYFWKCWTRTCKSCSGQSEYLYNMLKPHGITKRYVEEYCCKKGNKHGIIMEIVVKRLIKSIKKKKKVNHVSSRCCQTVLQSGMCPWNGKSWANLSEFGVFAVSEGGHYEVRQLEEAPPLSPGVRGNVRLLTPFHPQAKI